MKPMISWNLYSRGGTDYKQINIKISNKVIVHISNAERKNPELGTGKRLEVGVVMGCDFDFVSAFPIITIVNKEARALLASGSHLNTLRVITFRIKPSMQKREQKNKKLSPSCYG